MPALVVSLISARILHADQADEDGRGDRESMDAGVENLRGLEIVRMKFDMTDSRGGMMDVGMRMGVVKEWMHDM